jgi:mRNA-degrading endonuclease HigB of HigAB toxin-antitoxin module
MKIIGEARLDKFVDRHTPATLWASSWIEIVEDADWKSLAEVQTTYADAVEQGKYVRFSMTGGDYYLFTQIDYRAGIVLICDLKPR